MTLVKTGGNDTRKRGFEIIDIGVDVPVEAFQAAIHEYKPQIVGISALLTSTMQAMRETVQAIKKAGLDCKVIVGGAPIDQQFADEIGADAAVRMLQKRWIYAKSCASPTNVFPI